MGISLYMDMLQFREFTIESINAVELNSSFPLLIALL